MFVMVGQSLMMFVFDEVWVVVNYKEMQFRDMCLGQLVDICIDVYFGCKFIGYVDFVQLGFGIVFSLLLVENVIGNYVKVVQCVLVKIVVDNWFVDLLIGFGMLVVFWIKV